MCPTLPASSARSQSNSIFVSLVLLSRVLPLFFVFSLKPTSSWCFQQCTTSAPNRDAATRAWSTLWDRARLPAAVSTPPHWMTHPPITNLEKDYVTLVLLTPTIRQHRSAGFFRVYLFSNRGCKNSQGVVSYMKVFFHLKLRESLSSLKKGYLHLLQVWIAWFVPFSRLSFF